MAKIDQSAHKPSDAQNCDWFAWIKMDNGNFLQLQFGSANIDQDKADQIVAAITALTL